MVRTVLLVVLVSCSSSEGGGEGGRERQTKGAPRVIPQAVPESARPPVEELGQRIAVATSGIAATVAVPEGVEVSGRGDGIVRVGGEGYGVEISREPFDLDALRQFWRDNDVNRLARFVHDDPDAILAETDLLGRLEYHVTVNAAGLGCQSQREREWSLAHAELMLKSCRSLTVE